jgi:hypothetical protein
VGRTEAVSQLGGEHDELQCGSVMARGAAQAVSTCYMGCENVVWTAWTASERGVWSITKSTPRREFSTPRTNLGDATYKKIHATYKKYSRYIHVVNTMQRLVFSTPRIEKSTPRTDLGDATYKNSTPRTRYHPDRTPRSDAAHAVHTTFSHPLTC